MRTVHEVSELTGVSIRTLQYYDRIGLLCPAQRSDAGYRLYSNEDLARLQQILLFRELEFSLKDIRSIIESPEFNRSRALQQQIELLKLKREHIDKLIELATELQDATKQHSVKETRAMNMDVKGFEAFDTSKMDEYAAQAKASWGATAEWKDFEKKAAGRTPQDEATLGKELMSLFVPFGKMANEGVSPQDKEAMAQAQTIQQFITDHFYTCSDDVFAQLGKAYGSGGDFTQNINNAAGKGAAEFASCAVEAYIRSKTA